MLTSQDMVTREFNCKVILQFFEHLAARDMDKLINLWTDNVLSNAI